jgi:hypothetical protein
MLRSVYDEAMRSVHTRLSFSRESFMRVATLYGATGLLMTAVLTFMLIEYPLLPFQPNQVKWVQTWLAYAVIDCCLISLCMGGIVYATEGPPGIIWSLGILGLGTPVSCAYICSRIFWRKCLLSNRDEYVCSPAIGMIYAVAGATRIGATIWMLCKRWPLHAGPLAWQVDWLVAGTVDYELSALCLVAIIFASEGTFSAVLWSLGVCLSGSNFACMFTAKYLLQIGAMNRASSRALERQARGRLA